MRITFVSLCTTAVAALCMSLVGCGSASTETPGTTPPLTSEADHGDHEGHEDGDHEGHDHGDEAGHEHPTEGPHGGHLIELGKEEYHAELSHDENTHAVTIHLLDGAGKESVAIASPEITVQLFQDGQFVKYALKAVPGQGDAAGAASQFELVDAALCDALCEEEMSGRLQLTIDGKPYTGTIEHDSHDGHDHEGGDHEGHEPGDGHDH